MDDKKRYTPTFEELKDGDKVKVMTSYGWVEMTYPKIKETMFFRRANEIGFEKAVRRLINMKSIIKIKDE